MRRRARVCRPLTAVLLLAALVAPLRACEEPPPTPTVDPAVGLRNATLTWFGGDVDPAAVVARVDQQTITAGDLAVCLDAHPARTTPECLDELVDTEVLLAEASESDRADPRIADARTAGLASAYLRNAIDRPLADETISDADLDTFMADPANRLYFERPELRECSHLLIRTADGPSPEARALAERIWAQTDWSNVTTAADLDRVARQWEGEARQSQVSLRVEKHLLVSADNGQADASPLMTTFAPPFARAVFDLDAPTAVSPPVDTEFGVHIILLERIRRAEALPADQAVQLARSELGQRRRFETLRTLRDALRGHRDIIVTNAVEIFRAGDERLIQERSSEIRERFQLE